MSRCDCASCAAPSGRRCQCRADELPYDPFLALRVTYGMLLGEDDFTTLAANPRGKGMLHNSWLHGTGIAWGYDVAFDKVDHRPVLRVLPGLALDGIGRELHVDAAQCLDLDCWVADRLEDPPALSWTDDGKGCQTASLCLWLVAGFETCLTRPVPALADPCDPSRSHTDHSRVYETVGFELLGERPDPCPGATPPSGRYHGIRVLLGLAEPTGPKDVLGHEALMLRERIAWLPGWERATELLRCFRHLAAHDVTQLAPCNADGDDCAAWFPEAEAEPRVVLAKVELLLVKVNNCVTVADAAVDVLVRQALVPTHVIQELVCGLAPGVMGEDTVPDAGGPRVIPDSVSWSVDRTAFSFRVTAPLLEGSVNRGSLRVTTVSPAAGWNEPDIKVVAYQEATQTVAVQLYDRPTYPYVRLVVRGTGPTPVLGDDYVPLAGVEGGPPGTQARGHDADLVISPEVRT